MKAALPSHMLITTFIDLSLFLLCLFGMIHLSHLSFLKGTSELASFAGVRAKIVRLDPKEAVGFVLNTQQDPYRLSPKIAQKGHKTPWEISHELNLGCPSFEISWPYPKTLPFTASVFQTLPSLSGATCLPKLPSN